MKIITNSNGKIISANGKVFGVGSINSKSFDITISSDVKTSQQYVLANDSCIADHWSDDNFCASLMSKGGFQSMTSIQLQIHGNILRGTYYGAYLRSSASGVAVSSLSFPIKTAPSSDTQNGMFAKSNGDIGFNVSSTYPLRAGQYTLVAFW